MKRVISKGSDIQTLRLRLEKLSTQKEMANEVGVSIRKLRKIENENAPISIATASKLARALGVHREQIVVEDEDKTISMGRTVVLALPDFSAEISTLFDSNECKIIPRHDFDYAKATMDEAVLFKDANSSHDVECIFEARLTDATSGYAQELIDLLVQRTRSRRNILERPDPVSEIALRRRIRELMVLLRGNDIWIYTTTVHRTLPERDMLQPEGEPRDYQYRLVIAFAPPGEYGEESLRVPVDNGQPYVLRPWKEIAGKAEK
jgi:transcriptional regulator with XRE-family HTH domain